MKTNLRTLPVLALAFAATFASCKKEEKKQTADPATEILAHADDQTNFSTQIDALADDANSSMESNTYFGGRVMEPTTVNRMPAGGVLSIEQVLVSFIATLGKSWCMNKQ